MTDATPPFSASRPSFRWRARFSPHVLVLPVALMLSIPILRGAVASAIFWWHADSYAERLFVMDEFHPNAGSPYIRGHFAGETDDRRLLGLEQDGRRLVAADPTMAFEPGATVAVWHSDTAPAVVVFGREVNDVPISTLPVRPGLTSFLSYLLGLAMAAWATVRTMVWVYHRFSRQWGTPRVGEAGCPHR